MKLIVTFFALLLLASCASKPKLYPNSKYKEDPVVAQKSIDQCMDDADAYLESPKGKNIAKGAGAGAMIGGAIGAAAGIFTGNIGRGATQGAVMGGAGGAAGGALTPDQVKHNYVNQCLSEKGYQVIGWD